VSGSLIRQTSMEFGSKTRRYSRLSLRGFTISSSDFSTAIFASLTCCLHNGWVFGLPLFYLSIFFFPSPFSLWGKCGSRPVHFSFSFLEGDQSAYSHRSCDLQHRSSPAICSISTVYFSAHGSDQL
jgi:hypothetical protein